MRVLMIGPLAPPYGGVANFIEQVAKQMNSDNVKVRLHRVGRRRYNTNMFKQFFIDIFDITNFIIKGEFRDNDVVHIHTSSYYSFYRKSVYFFIVKFLSNNKSKIIIHIHGAKFDNFYYGSNLISKKLIRYVLSNCNTIVVTSQRWIPIFKNIVKSDNKDNNQIFVIYNGFDSNLFKHVPIEEVRNNINIPQDKKILLNIAALEEYKGHKYLIDAMEIIKKERNDILVYVIGEGSLKQKLEKVIKNKDLEKNIFLLGGGKSHNDVLNLVNACDMFVLPSLAEGNPTVMFEAIGCGKPFVGTHVGGVPDIIISDNYGLLVEPENSKDMAEKILVALDREWDSKRIVEYAQRFTWKNISRDILKIYENMI